MEPIHAEERLIQAPNKVAIYNKWLTVVLIILCVAVSWAGVIDGKTEKYVDDALKQALVAYGSARVLNAGISVMQSAEFGAGIGVNASIHPLEALDPIDDMVEDFATAMKYAIASLMTQKLVLEIMSANLFKWLLLVSALLFFVSIFAFDGQYSKPILKSFLFITMIRFLFVLTIFLSGFVDSKFVNDKTVEEMNKVSKAEDAVKSFEVDKYGEIDIDGMRQELSKNIERQKSHVDEVNNIYKISKQNTDGILEGKRWYEQIPLFIFSSRDSKYYESKQLTEKTYEVYKEQEKLLHQMESELKSLENGPTLLEDAKEKVAALKNLVNYEKVKKAMADSIEAMLYLIAFFIFKTLVMPIAFIFVLLRGFKMLWGIDTSNFLRGQKTKRIKAS